MAVFVRTQALQHGYMGVLAKAVAEVAAHSTPFDEIKLRYALGKQTFYESRGSGSLAALAASYSAPAELNACTIGHQGMLNARWEIPASAPAPGRASFRPPGFSQLDLSLKPAMVTFINARPGALDLRIKLLAQYHILRDSVDVDARAAWRLAESLRWDTMRQMGGHRTEVGGSCVELQQLLQDTKADATAADVEAALGPAVMSLVSFLDVLVDGR
ncbi:hypothetical protein FOA52_001424 [Chlamydomonas sp. UWO 241]|nr:hypothetical protein FOA52_001424 [Chlamydomonas sp. UWO 241]